MDSSHRTSQSPSNRRGLTLILVLNRWQRRSFASRSETTSFCGMVAMWSGRGRESELESQPLTRFRRTAGDFRGWYRCTAGQSARIQKHPLAQRRLFVSTKTLSQTRRCLNRLTSPLHRQVSQVVLTDTNVNVPPSRRITPRLRAVCSTSCPLPRGSSATFPYAFLDTSTITCHHSVT